MSKASAFCAVECAECACSVSQSSPAVLYIVVCISSSLPFIPPPYLLILNSYLYETENSDLANWITGKGKWCNAWLSFSENRRHKTSHVSVCIRLSGADLCPLSSSCSPSIPFLTGILPHPHSSLSLVSGKPYELSSTGQS